MTHEAIIEKVKKKYAGADEATIHAVLQTLQDDKVDLRWPDLSSVMDVAKKPAITSKPPLQFFGENLSPEEYRKLSLDERGDLKQRLKEQNREWLEEKFSTLNVAWIMVLDGKIIASGDGLQTYPRVEQIREMSSRYGKRPFIFVNDLFLAIEESGMTWHQTAYRNDFYPTVPITLRAASGSVAIAADFDAGSASSFVDYDLLLAHAIIEPREEEEAESAEHLGQIFKFVNKPITVEVKLPSGEVLYYRELIIVCVTKWKQSPFVRINPRRTALAGRDIFLELQPSVTLDFANRRTTISAPTTA
ncbi:MAG: hypothetical protein ACREOI_32155 [bacterium]